GVVPGGVAPELALPDPMYGRVLMRLEALEQRLGQPPIGSAPLPEAAIQNPKSKIQNPKSQRPVPRLAGPGVRAPRPLGQPPGALPVPRPEPPAALLQPRLRLLHPDGRGPRRPPGGRGRRAAAATGSEHRRG